MGRITQYGSEADRAWVGAEYRVDLFPTVIFLQWLIHCILHGVARGGFGGSDPSPLKNVKKF